MSLGVQDACNVRVFVFFNYEDNMKKVLLGAAISAALFGGAAQAAITFTAGLLPSAATLADSTVVYLSGSSAMAELIERGLTIGTNEGVCKVGTVHKFTDSSANQAAYICEFNTAANGSTTPNTSIPAGITTSNLLIYKRNEGGSAQGVLPIVTPASIAFLNITNDANSAGTASCVAASAGVFASTKTCAYNSSTNRTSVVPTFGLADVNPQIFTVPSENAAIGTVPATPPGPSTAATGYSIVPAPALAFGVVVNLKLRNALQEAQFGLGNSCVGSETEACMPNLNSNTLAAIFSAYPAPVSPLKANISAPAQGAGKIHQWTQLKVGATDLFNNASVKPGSAKVHICSRTVGSGTKAQFGVKFLGTVCNTQGGKIVQHADHTAIGETFAGGKQTTYVAGPIANPEALLRPMVHAMSSGGGLEECLTDLDSGAADATGSFQAGTNYGAAGTAGTRWAIGFHSMDKNSVGTGTTIPKAFRFIKVDGVAPTLANVANGTYGDWVEGTFQYNNTTLPAGSTRALVNEIISSFTTPSVLSFVNTKVGTHLFGTSGFLAVPNAAHPATTTGKVNLALPVNPLSHAIFPGTATQATNNCRTPIIYSNSAPVNNTQGLQIVQ